MTEACGPDTEREMVDFGTFAEILVSKWAKWRGYA